MGEQLPALLDEKQIMAIIANKDDDLKYKKNQIELFFSVHSDAQERAEYLKSAYQRPVHRDHRRWAAPGI